MKILMELVPSRNKGFVDEIVESTKELVDCYDIPESPLGVPSINSVATAIYLKNVIGVDAIPHIRLYDVNRVALLSLIYAVKAYGIGKVVLTHGDPPRQGIIVKDIDTRGAVNLIKKHVPEILVGAIMSLRYDLDSLLDRLRIGADFFLVLRLSHEYLDKYTHVLERAEKRGIQLYPYIIVKTEKNKELVDSLNQPYVGINKLKDFVKEIKHLLHGVIVSVPLDYDGLKKALNIIRSVV